MTRRRVFNPRYSHERRRLHLQLKSISRGDYFNGYPHDLCWFVDEEGNHYSYQAPYSDDYNKQTKLAQALEFAEGIWFDLTADVINDGGSSFVLYNPRLLKKYEET